MAETSESKLLTLDVPCDCAGCCSILRFQRWDDEPEFYADAYIVWDVDRGFWHRLKLAVKVLFKAEAVRHSMVLYPPTVHMLSRWLRAHDEFPPDAKGEQA